MKTIGPYDVLTEMFKTQSSCKISDLQKFKEDKEKEDKDIYVAINRKAILAEISAHKELFYWDFENETVHKQEVLECFICGETHYMFPDVQKFVKIKETYERIKNKL